MPEEDDVVQEKSSLPMIIILVVVALAMGGGGFFIGKKLGNKEEAPKEKQKQEEQEDNVVELKGKNINSSLKGSYASDNLELLMDFELPLTVRIGSMEMKIIDIMRLGLGSLLELEKMVDDPVEIVVYDGNFAVRINNVSIKGSRIKSLG